MRRSSKLRKVRRAAHLRAKRQKNIVEAPISPIDTPSTNVVFKRVETNVPRNLAVFSLPPNYALLPRFSKKPPGPILAEIFPQASHQVLREESMLIPISPDQTVAILTKQSGTEGRTPTNRAQVFAGQRQAKSTYTRMAGSRRGPLSGGTWNDIFTKQTTVVNQKNHDGEPYLCCQQPRLLAMLENNGPKRVADYVKKVVEASSDKFIASDTVSKLLEATARHPWKPPLEEDEIELLAGIQIFAGHPNYIPRSGVRYDLVVMQIDQS